MSNYIMNVNFFGHDVRCETENNLVSLNDLVIAGNKWRGENGLPLKNIADLTKTQAYADFRDAVASTLNVSPESLVQTVMGRKGRTMVHVFLAIYVAEQISPLFHVKVIQTFVEGKLLEFRDLGGTEFKNLNAAIDLYLPDRLGKDNKGVYITLAKIIREKILGQNTTWDSATVDQTHSRYSIEKRLVDYLRQGLITDYEHLKQITLRIEK